MIDGTHERKQNYYGITHWFLYWLFYFFCSTVFFSIFTVYMSSTHISCYPHYGIHDSFASVFLYFYFSCCQKDRFHWFLWKHNMAQNCFIIIFILIYILFPIPSLCVREREKTTTITPSTNDSNECVC